MTDQTAITTPNDNSLKAFMRSDAIFSRFEEILGERGAKAYVSSVLLTVANNDALQKCTRASVVASALRAATLSLSCDPSIGQAYLVPYGNVATFVVGYKGLRDMALRTNKYRYIHVDKIYVGEDVEVDRITGSARIIGGKESNEIAGWVASFEMTNGFRKSVYMTREEIHEHARKYSKGYDRNGGVWKQNPSMMEKKTVLRQLLTHWGVLDSRDALFMSEVDGAEGEELEYIDTTFTPAPHSREDVSEDDIMAEIGFSSPSPTPAPQESYPMALDLAETVKDSKGVFYKDYTPAELKKHVPWIEKAMQKEQDDERRTQLQFKRDACNTLIQYAANHPENGQAELL